MKIFKMIQKLKDRKGQQKVEQTGKRSKEMDMLNGGLVVGPNAALANLIGQDLLPAYERVGTAGYGESGIKNQCPPAHDAEFCIVCWGHFCYKRMILALRSTASSFACVEAIRSFPRQSSLIRSMTVCFVAGSSPVNGSSMRMI